MEECCIRAVKLGKASRYSRRCREKCEEEFNEKLNQFMLDLETFGTYKEEISKDPYT